MTSDPFLSFSRNCSYATDFSLCLSGIIFNKADHVQPSAVIMRRLITTDTS